VTEAQGNEAPFKLECYHSAQEAVIRTSEIMRDSWYCVWRSEQLGSCISSLSKANPKNNIANIRVQLSMKRVGLVYISQLT
jgi:hypothetical protein